MCNRLKPMSDYFTYLAHAESVHWHRIQIFALHTVVHRESKRVFLQFSPPANVTKLMSWIALWKVCILYTMFVRGLLLNLAARC